jgi:D-serine deaminase-like pyridoxal phosphate-dependent protein
VTEALKPLVETRTLIAASGIAVKIVSSGGTGTYDVTGNIDGIDEVQTGSYALMDANYRKLRPEFKSAAFVLATVISVTGSRAVTDVGTKGQGCEFGPPVIDGRPEAKVRGAAEEHTIIDNCPAKVGERLRLVPSHMCTTSNLYRRFRVMRGGLIEATWPIEGSGCVE